MSDDFLFVDDVEEVDVLPEQTWKILVVDDEPEVHAVTKLALSDFVFEERRLEFLSAYSGEEAKVLFQQHSDIAVVLLDVVMESDDAGLKVAEFVRETCLNHFTRIILRTGQPGQAPEKDIIVNYDINDYKSKTELTAQKLFTVVIASLRSYRDIMCIEEHRQGLEKIIKASANLFSIHNLESFIQGLIQQLSSLIGGTQDAAYITSAVAAPKPIDRPNADQYFVFTGNGDYTNKEGKPLEQVVGGERLVACKSALSSKDIVYGDDHLAAYCHSKSGKGSLLFLSGLPRKLTSIDRKLIEIFTQNVQIAFDNVMLTKEIEDTQREVVERLGNAAEGVPQNYHSSRIADVCAMLGEAVGMTPEEIAMLRLAAPLHDIGKFCIPNRVLTKPGKLDPEEIELVRKHTELGYELLKDSTRPSIQMAATLARDHHEHWDGSGYPKGLKGNSISIACRITTLADVFDALRCQTSYKEAWSMDRVCAAIKEESGKHFDPTLVTLLLDRRAELESIYAVYGDGSNLATG